MDLKSRVRRRVEELNTSPITLARKVGLERGFINDILIGRKKTISTNKVDLVAQALEVDPSYLIDSVAPEQEVLAAPETDDSPGLAVLGVCHPGIWRAPGARPDYPERVVVNPDIRFLSLRQDAYLVRGYQDCITPQQHSNTELVVLAVPFEAFRKSGHKLEHNMTVVIQREQSGFTETSLRVIQGTSSGLQLIEPPIYDSVGETSPIALDSRLRTADGISIQAVGLSMVKFLL